MPELEIQPFSEQHLDAAAALLAKRHERHREVEPLLSSTIDFRAELDALRTADGASGAVAVRNGEIAGYLLGIAKDEGVWGPNVWVEPAGHAVDEPELVRDLYAAAATIWVEEGRRRHYSLVPATDADLVDAWFRLSFGAQQAAGIRETPDSADPTSSVVVRRAVADDVDECLPLDFELGRYQELSPVFAGGSTETEDEAREYFLKEVEDEDVGLLIGEIEGRIVSLLVVATVEKSGMHAGPARPERAALIGYAATLPEARGSGAGVALTNAAFAWARERDLPVVVVDWRETNLLASRFWPRRGFRRTFLRLYRSIP